MNRDFNEFSALRISRFVFYTISAIALYFAGAELESSNLKLAAAIFCYCRRFGNYSKSTATVW